MAVQAALLVALFLAPSGDIWPTPGWVRTLATIGFWLGFAYAALAAVWMRGSLTALPVPKPGGALCTTGPFARSRHPIYFGVLVLCAAMTLRRASTTALVVFALLVVFFNIKARWEEPHLAARYPGYGDYQRRTNRLVPRIR